MNKKIVILLSTLFLAIFFVGCGASSANVASKSKTIYISGVANYSQNSSTAENIRTECTLTTQLMDYLVVYGEKSNIKFIVKKDINKNDKVLKLEIDNAVSSGNAFTGYKKIVTISGKMMQNDKVLSQFKAARKSRAAFMGGFTCAILGKAVKSLAKDTAVWTVNERNGARIGNTRYLR